MYRVRLVSSLQQKLSRLAGPGGLHASAAVLPSGTMLYGPASPSGERFNIHFSRIKLPDGREAAFDGIAYDTEDKKPGLRSSQHIRGASSQGPSVAEAVVKGAATPRFRKVTG